MALNKFSSHEYETKKINFHPESFKIFGVSDYTDYIKKNINYDCELNMVYDINNSYDKEAIAIQHNGNTIGYVPRKGDYKDKMKKYITNSNKLKIINIKPIKTTKVTGIRVIPESLYEPEMRDESIFGD